ncbi:hypothetical protein V6N12_058567 [Hibiscus sabdariffa]|uniref:RRM domain-containing protein n=1 Tax=Hibiscus sabdariffa TaxID=183260 RepID=A0ABR2EWK3_9ROSI
MIDLICKSLCDGEFPCLSSLWTAVLCFKYDLLAVLCFGLRSGRAKGVPKRNKQQRRFLGKGISSVRGYRDGVLVFINFVSKRIHKSGLKEAFVVYGKVLDVYIAYNNTKRVGMNNTFAFVRFSCLGEALRAVNQGNGRLMDGFSIKVFLEKRLSTQARKPKVDALREDVQDGTMWVEDRPESNTNIIQVNVFEYEREWIKSFVVGQIKAMYDTELVQQALQADGFKITVCQWLGFYAVIRFEEEEQIPIFWDLKESLLKSWFTDIDTVDNFMNKKKFRVWVRIEGMPLMAWIEEETAKKLRFDGARILLGVSCLSDVPLTAAISFEGESFWLRISIVEFEDESEKLQSEGGFINNLEGVSPRALPNERGDGPTLGETQEDGLDNLGSSQTITLGGSAGAVPLIETQIPKIFKLSKLFFVRPVFSKQQSGAEQQIGKDWELFWAR